MQQGSAQTALVLVPLYLLELKVILERLSDRTLLLLTTTHIGIPTSSGLTPIWF